MQVRLRSRVPADQVKPWAGHHPTTDHYDLMATGNVDIYGADGKPALIVRRNMLNRENIERARPALWFMKTMKTDNRGNYGGGGRVVKIRGDGTKSKSASRAALVRSTVAGYFEPMGGRHPYCREAAFNQHNPERWEAIVPFLRDVAALYQKTMPERYSRQMAFVNRSHPAWIIDGTPFTTITVNNTVPAAYHQDGGDLSEGFGVMVVLRDGTYNGFELVVPEHRVAVDLHDGDVVFFDPTLWHGNVPPHGMVGEELEDYNRISVVCYYRKGIIGCLSPAEEVQKAKERNTL